jgi:hypothetical protein
MERFTVIGYVNSGLNLLIDDWAVWLSSGLVAGVILARLQKEKRSRAKFLKQISEKETTKAKI